MKSAFGLITCGAFFWASTLFADCDWVLWKSKSYLNPAVFLAIGGRQSFPEELMVKKWEYLDVFQDKKECQFASEEKMGDFISAQKAIIKKRSMRKEPMKQHQKFTASPRKAVSQLRRIYRNPACVWQG
ncbi:MAG: hypothetical protein WD032_06560 [Nitrospirales bacterium]